MTYVLTLDFEADNDTAARFAIKSLLTSLKRRHVEYSQKRVLLQCIDAGADYANLLDPEKH